jgi:hypothetical protein
MLRMETYDVPCQCDACQRTVPRGLLIDTAEAPAEAPRVYCATCAGVIVKILSKQVSELHKAEREEAA